MKRTGRLLELMIALNGKQRFTVQELADEFEVSRRTMLRDLQLLSEMGVPLHSVPGPHGGYSVIRSQQLPPVSLTTTEAIGLIMSYEALEEYADGPFRKEHLSALTKLRSVLPAEVLDEVQDFRERVTLKVPKRTYQVPYLSDLLQAAKQRVHVEIDYESCSGRSKRVIFPYGLIMSGGFWYCPAYCYTREERVWFRADRVLGLAALPEFEGDAPLLRLQDVMSGAARDAKKKMRLQVTLTPRGCKLGDGHALFGSWIESRGPEGGVIEQDIEAGEVAIVGRFLLGLGSEARVSEPPEMMAFLQEEARKIALLYA